ncbi:MAG: multidrug efflux RND transporter permease subunit, partial [Gemmatimonadota bacterium]|nr:multidrug efflux RND transporter permease subunit [Gemmatimonadota bacterium]
MSAAPPRDATPATEPEIRNLFIRRPIFSAVISIVLVLLGIYALTILPINRYPEISPPVVQINTSYPGATAQDVAQTVAAPIEQQLAGIPGLLYYKSTSSADGSMSMQVTFDISRDQDLAAVDVQNQVQLALPQLPEEVRRNGVIVTKAQTQILLLAVLSSTDPRYGPEFLSNYSKIYLEDEIKRIPGIGNATTFGQLGFAMNIDVDPDKMSQLGVTVSDLANAVREQNSTNPAGLIGREPSRPGTQLTLPVTTLGRLTKPEQFSNIIVRAQPDGSVLRVSDIASVNLGARDYGLISKFDGKPVAGILVFQRTGANALDVKNAFVKRMTELQNNFPPGVHWQIGFDTTPFITASIDEVVHTLAIAMLLVTFVVFAFLQNWRSTLIPLLAVPVSIVGTFLGLWLLGFTINLLTLFGLVLAIGIVVDDAIVVIENVERIMAQDKVSPAVAADRAMHQVSGALIAIVLVLCAVFIPVALVGGITGQMYKQFAVTIVFSVVLSGIVALTLTPALCAVLLKQGDHTPKRGPFAWFNRTFDRTRERYLGTLGKLLVRPKTVFASFAVIVALVVVLVRIVPTGFLPAEDKGFFVVSIDLPGGASRQRTDSVVARIETYLRAQPAVAHTVALVGLSFLQGANQTSSATIFVGLKPFDQRKSANDQVDAVLGRANGEFFKIKEATAFGFNFPEIPGLGTTAGLEMNLQDRGINDVVKFAGLAQQFVRDANQLPELQRVSTNVNVNVPQIFVTVDREKVKALGINLADLFQTQQAMLSTLYINDFNLYGKTFRVQAEAQPQFRQRPEDIGRLYVRTAAGQMVPVSSLVKTEFRGGPNVLTRFNGFTSAIVNGSPAPGKSSGEMLAAVKRLADEKYANQGVGYAFSGQSYQETSGGSGSRIFVLGIVMVFLVLAALYESWSIPFAVLFGVPFGLLGAMLGVYFRGIPNDIYFQIGIIVVIGLAAKNAILIVEFANTLRTGGLSIVDAAIEAARERLRPILMTSFAFILGVVPLLIASGAGAGGRHSIGTGVFFGMLLATTVG